jgi:hypothetical protein
MKKGRGAFNIVLLVFLIIISLVVFLLILYDKDIPRIGPEGIGDDEGVSGEECWREAALEIGTVPDNFPDYRACADYMDDRFVACRDCCGRENTACINWCSEQAAANRNSFCCNPDHVENPNNPNCDDE